MSTELLERKIEAPPAAFNPPTSPLHNQHRSRASGGLHGRVRAEPPSRFAWCPDLLYGMTGAAGAAGIVYYGSRISVGDPTLVLDCLGFAISTAAGLSGVTSLLHTWLWRPRVSLGTLEDELEVDVENQNKLVQATTKVVTAATGQVTALGTAVQAQSTNLQTLSHVDGELANTLAGLEKERKAALEELERVRKLAQDQQRLIAELQKGVGNVQSVATDVDKTSMAIAGEENSLKHDAASIHQDNEKLRALVAALNEDIRKLQQASAADKQLFTERTAQLEALTGQIKKQAAQQQAVYEQVIEQQNQVLSSFSPVRATATAIAGSNQGLTSVSSDINTTANQLATSVAALAPLNQVVIDLRALIAQEKTPSGGASTAPTSAEK